jgi:L-Ala-D/L-Glu epimerase / N-acetyl-D-glutamate racemase
MYCTCHFSECFLEHLQTSVSFGFRRPPSLGAGSLVRMKRTLNVHVRSWLMKEPFVLARGTQHQADVIVVELAEQGAVGRGEAAGVRYRGEAPQDMAAEIQRIRPSIEAGADRADLLRLLPAGGARNAVDAALWDLQAKLSGTRTWQQAGLAQGTAVVTAITIGMRSLIAYEEAAAKLAGNPWIKIKVNGADPLEAVKAVRRGAPLARLVVDANQSWSVADVRAYAPELASLGVSLLEQPVAVGQDDDLAGLECPVPICADESLQTVADLPRLIGRYDFINIKLDKTGGLTAALDLARAARNAGLRLMSGCMAGSSLSMAPAMVLGQVCEINDLDAAWLLAEDWPGGIVYEQGVMRPPWPEFWG